MGKLRLRVLGPFSIEHEHGQGLTLTTRKAQALLGLLALEPEGVSRDYAAQLL